MCRNRNCYVDVRTQRFFEVALNNESEQEIPAVVCFGGGEQSIEAAGATSAIMEPTTTISHIKQLIGRSFSDPELQKDLNLFTVTEGRDGFPLIHVRDSQGSRTYTSTQVLGLLFSRLKEIVEKKLNVLVADCCIGVPIYFNDLQMRAILDAAALAELHPNQLVHETTATVITCASSNEDFLSTDSDICVAFIDISYSSMQVTIALICKDHASICAHSFDWNLGGRDFDDVLFQHFFARIKEKYNINVFQSTSACRKLRAASEKLKQALSTTLEASLNIEGLVGNQNVIVSITREEFEKISFPILERVKKALVKALAEAHRGVGHIDAVEVAGSASKVPAILKILTEFFGKEPKRTIKTAGSVAIGCARNCATVGHPSRNSFRVSDWLPFAIFVSWKGNAREAQSSRATECLTKWSLIRKTKRVTIPQLDRLMTVNLQYAGTSDLQAPHRVTYVIGPLPKVEDGHATLQVEVHLNRHGIASIQSAVHEHTYAKTLAPWATEVNVSEVAYGVLSEAVVREKVEMEIEKLQKLFIKATNVQRNVVEANAYDVRPQGSYQCIQFSFSDLKKATKDFDSSLKIAEGGYGSMYKGVFNRSEFAIKIPHTDSLQGPLEFQKVVEVLTKLRHPNMVTLIGFCPESQALIYEYPPGGRLLEDQLNPEDPNSLALSWQARIQIATDLCSVLNFLHSSQPNGLIHGDLNPSNILLDANFVLKLGYFGTRHLISNGKLSTEQTMKFFTTEPTDTYSYVDPGFLATGELTTKSDVYSFGVILLRLLTGQPALGIVNEVQNALDRDLFNGMLPPSAGNWPFVQAKQLAQLALRCCDINARNRPDLASEIFRVLEFFKAGLSTLRAVVDDQVPDYFLCPIYKEIMKDPVIAADSITYEAEAFRNWIIRGHKTSPMTNLELKSYTVVPNRALRSAIQEWLQHNCIV